MESIAQIEERHEKEMKELKGKLKMMLKAAKKSEKAQMEAQGLQMEYDLKAKHRQEVDEAEENGAPTGKWFLFLFLGLIDVYRISGEAYLDFETRSEACRRRYGRSEESESQEETSTFIQSTLLCSNYFLF
jgi:hypothetical protein